MFAKPPNRAKVLSRALAEKAKLNETYRQNPSDEDAAASSDAETRRRNTAVVRALRTTSSRSSHAGPPLFNPATRSSARPNTRDRDRDREHSRAGSHSAKMAQLVEDTVWKLDAYDNQPRRMRDKYYAYREWLVRNEGTVPMDIDSGANPPAAGGSASASSSTMMIPKSTTGSTNYDASRDPRLHR